MFRHIADVAGDAADGTRSLPVLLGKQQRTLALILTLDVVDAVVGLLVMFPRLLQPVHSLRCSSPTWLWRPMPWTTTLAALSAPQSGLPTGSWVRWHCCCCCFTGTEWLLHACSACSCCV